MATRLALVGCKNPHDGPWTVARGNESALQIFELGEGALIRFECMSEGLLETFDYAEIGEHPLPKLQYQRYRVCKVGEPGLATIVRVVLNGVA